MMRQNDRRPARRLALLSMLLGATFGASACGYSDAVFVGGNVVVFKNGFFGATRSINICGTSDESLTGCKPQEDKELSVGDPNAASAVAPAPAPAVEEPPAPVAEPAPAPVTETKPEPKKDPKAKEPKGKKGKKK